MKKWFVPSILSFLFWAVMLLSTTDDMVLGWISVFGLTTSLIVVWISGIAILKEEATR